MIRYQTAAVLALVIVLLGSAVYGVWRSPAVRIPLAIHECAAVPANMKALCYTDKVDAVLRISGLRAALSLVAASYKADPAVASFCHGNMHELGAAAYKQFAARGAIDLTTDGSFCGFGFYHGFMEEMLLETGSLDQAKAFCTYVGKTLGGDQTYAEGSCYHGIGHGVTDGTDVYDRGNAAALAASGLALCKKITDSGELEMRCTSGVFNSIALMYRDPTYKLHVGSDPYALCRTPSYDINEKKACYDQMNTLVAYVSKKDMRKSIGYAMQISDPTYRAIALKGAMLMAYLAPTKNQRSDAPSLCDTLNGTDRSACVRGLLGSVVEFGAPGSEVDAGIAFCEQPGWSGDDARNCADELVIYSEGLFSPAAQKEICARLPADIRSEHCTS